MSTLKYLKNRIFLFWRGNSYFITIKLNWIEKDETSWKSSDKYFFKLLRYSKFQIFNVAVYPYGLEFIKLQFPGHKYMTDDY